MSMETLKIFSNSSILMLLNIFVGNGEGLIPFPLILMFFLVSTT